jgi:predicted ArsR family transcriptional regulator
MADAVLRVIPALRETDGDARVNAMLESINKRNAREAGQLKKEKPPRTAETSAAGIT